MKERSRKFCLLLYSDNEKHMKALAKIKLNYNYALILHNRDVDKNGELKKEHYHVVIENKNAIWSSALSKELELEDRFIQVCRNFDNALEYLIHYNDPKKFQYNIQDVQGTLKNKLIKTLSDNHLSEEDKMQFIFDYINEMDLLISVRAMSEFCHIQGIWDTFRRNSSIIFKLIDEHNIKIQRKEFKNECSRLSQI